MVSMVSWFGEIDLFYQKRPNSKSQPNQMTLTSAVRSASYMPFFFFFSGKLV